MKKKRPVPLQYRQGDIFLERVHDLPTTATALPPMAGRVVLAYGEATGHNHSLGGQMARLFASPEGRRYLSVLTQGAALQHQEHQEVWIAPGIYEVVRQKEYTPAAIREVTD